MIGSVSCKNIRQLQLDSEGGSIRSVHTYLLAIAIVAVYLSQVAQGQLRTGRVDRNLERPAVASSVASQPAGRTSVRTVSYQDDSGSSILSPTVQQSGESYYDDAVSSGIVVDEYYEGSSLSPVPHSSSSGFGHSSGCGDVGCDSCAGSYTGLAPSCISVGPPGRGLLQSLWCRMSVRAEVPLFWRRAAAPPALVTTSDAGTLIGDAGQLGLSTTDILLGDTRLNEDSNAGFRLTLATWLGQREEYGLMFRYWTAGDQDDEYSFGSNQFPILARPFFNTSIANAFENDALVVAFPGTSTGSIRVATTSSVEGLELSLKRLLYRDRFTRIDWLYGYQHASIDESIGISSTTSASTGEQLAISDNFSTENNFHGVSYGIAGTRHFSCWKLETMFRLGLGNLRRNVNVSGSTTATSTGSVTTPQGLLARSTNSIAFEDDTFVVIPEVGINLAYQLRPGLDFTLGYNYMLVPKVAQASQQINDSLASNLSDPFSGSADPAFQFDERNFWLNSLGLGLQWRY